MAVAQLASALALYGDTQRSEATFEAAVRLARQATDYDYYRSDYGSPLRDGAAMLALAAESRPMPGVVPALVKLVGTERTRAGWTSTQDQSWMLLAARALKDGNDAISLDIDGQPHKGAYSTEIAGGDLAENPLTVANRGKEALQAVVTTLAAPVQPLPAGGEGFTIERAYYKLDGTEANVSEAVQNERYVVVLKIYEKNDWPQRVLVTDLLPAGFEIDNPSLVSSAQLANFSWLSQTNPAHVEFRNDRFVAAFGPGGEGDADGSQDDGDRSKTLAYVVRAVTPGVYAHPAASVEDMYRPQYSARTATGMMEVKAP